MEEASNLETAPLRYAGVATLLRRPLVNDPSGVDIALIGVPYDDATENRPGPRHGPREIRNMSSLTRSVHHLTWVNPYELCYRIATPMPPVGVQWYEKSQQAIKTVKAFS